MKAIILKGFGGTENFELREHMGLPEIGPEEVLVKIMATAFNPIDYQMRQGRSESKRLHSPVLGREFSGTVVRVGTKVRSFHTGDAVFSASGSMGSNGTYAEYIVVPAAILTIKPVHLSYQQAAAIPVVYLTALQIVDRLGIKSSDRILLTGAAGGVGLALIKLLNANADHHIVATAGNVKSKAVLLEAGLADRQIVDYHQPDLKNLILAENEGEMFDFCIDLVGGEMSELCASLIRVNGSYADVTALGTSKALSDFFDKGATVYHISNYAYALFNHYKWYGDQLGRIAGMLENQEITAPPLLVFDSFTIQSVAEAHQILEENRTNGKKIVMNISTA
ncbi:NADP-dependent oxidoreductase [Pedobacter gandavensis]|uniref:quinone oxidoreductase family protein n=1 Tax=Pedobacter gandavensis TaxID=2679963 RepID=UPI002930B1EE|nr:NADP-dependent oxidoreductase [Pedobacter gandavensis]